MRKELVFIVALALMASAFLVQRHTEPEVIISDEKIEVFFAKGMSQSELKTIQNQMREVGITLTYTDLKFRNDRLTSMKFDIKDSNGQSGGAYYTFPFFLKRRFGFFISRKADAPVSLMVGNF